MTRLVRDIRNAVIEECAEVVAKIRQTEAVMFDEEHCGQRGFDRSSAFHEAYVAILSLKGEQK